MDLEDKIEFTKTVFQNVKYDSRNRLQTALRRRSETQEILRSGGDENYRILWLRQSVIRMINELSAIAGDFDAKYPDDRCTNHDFVDILTSTLSTVRKL